MSKPTLTLSQVFAKAGKDDISYVRDGPIHYIVMTRKDNTWNMDRVNKYMAILDEIEKTDGPGVMITIGTGPRIFSSGFDLPWWMESYETRMKPSIVRF